MAAIVGIDLGSKNCVIAVVEKGGVEIVTNEVSNRSTPVLVGFGAKERYIGEPALNLIKSNFRNTIQFPTRFLGLGPDYANLAEEKKWLTSKIVVTEKQKLGFEVRYKQQVCVFTCEEILAMFLQKLKITLNSSKRACKDVCISVPCYLSHVERQAVLDACRIADINCLKLMNNDTAVALNYGLFRQKELTEQPRVVCFVDMGHSKTTVTLASFTKEKLTILARAFDRDLGGRDFDYYLIQKFAQDFERKYSLNPLESPKAVIRMQEQIEKLKKILSSNIEAELNIDSLLEDNDLSSMFTREELETLSKPLLIRFQNLLEIVTQGFDKSQIHSVEIVGGSTRIPAIQWTLKNFFNMEVSKTLQANECIARGCAVQAAVLSPVFKVKEFGIEDISTIPISIKYSETSAPTELFPLNSKFPQIRSLQFNKSQVFELEAFYPNWNIAGINGNLGLFKINCPKSENNLSITVFAKLNVHCMFVIENAEHIERYEEEVEEPIKPEEKKAEETKEKQKDQNAMDIEPTPEQQQQEQKPEEQNQEQKQEQKQEQPPQPQTKKVIKKRKRVHKIQVDVVSSHGLVDKEIQEAFKKEIQMNSEDKIIRETAESKNELESYVYNMRNHLSSTYSQYCNNQTKQQFLENLQNVENWLYDQGTESTKEVYLQKMKELKNIGDPIELRYREYQLIPQELKRLQDTLTHYLNLAQSKDAQYEHIEQSERQKLLDEIMQQDKWISNTFKRQEGVTNDQDPVINSYEVKLKIEEITKLGNAIMNKPKPTPLPQATEAKTEAPKVEAQKPEEQKEQKEENKTQQEDKMDLD